jgi:hypothetical protein
MNNKIESVREVKEVNKIPFGEYLGLWGGYVVTFVIGNKKYEAQTEDGVRGMNIPCTVISDENGIRIKL